MGEELQAMKAAAAGVSTLEVQGSISRFVISNYVRFFPCRCSRSSSFRTWRQLDGPGTEAQR
jgi:hypothetical protein